MVNPSTTDPAPEALRDRLEHLRLTDARRLARRLEAARRTRDQSERERSLAKIATAVAAAEDKIERRRQVTPAVSFPAELPVSQRRDDLAHAIADHQVVIVAGETGSGKTTQLPKICLELGRGVRGMIGHTQPRRLAARTVAERICEELGTELGAAVGYAVRFTDRVGEDTLVKVMTDGILLTDIHRDRDLLAYDTLIIDEAHERSLNIDFILGYLRDLLPRRPDLKVVITSATIDPERFSRHFGGAPIIEVSGRTHPVEVRYRPLDPESEAEEEASEAPEPTRRRPQRDQVQAICDAVRELQGEGPGDILVFLSGEREIRDAADALRELELINTEILPLYARLSSAEQHRVFAAHRGRRIVLATNVAETSLTVPGIRYVVDPGTARISRYSHRLKVQRLPIEAISQASANQRAGRCGRVAPGICIRLYSEADYAARPLFTEPEILRTNLASVILQMTALGLGDLAVFPFVEPPDRRAVADGVRLLQELGALETAPEPGPPKLTPIGRQLARLPVDPRFGRMVLEADRSGCLREVLVIAAALSIEDPRERPGEHAAAADQFHARFADPGSDFMAYLNLWRYVREQQRELSSNQFRKRCRAEYLNHLRLREWQDVHSQLRHVVGELGMRVGAETTDPDAIHRALLSGLLSHIGMRDRDTREFRGARNMRFAVFPGSTLSKKPPQWVMAAELVETSRLFARTVARIQPEWAERLGAHLVQYSYSEPHWSRQRGAAMAYESASLYGLPIVSRRLVPFHRVDREQARELFIRHALVEGDWDTHHQFPQQNREVLDEVVARGHRFRRHHVLADDALLERRYDEILPAEVVSARHFDSWWKKVRRSRPGLLTFTAQSLLGADDPGIDEAQFPARWEQGALRLPMSYVFEPGSDDDGPMVHIPLEVLNRVDPAGFDWQVPGLREELAQALVRTLPKTVRRTLLPLAETVRTALSRLDYQRSWHEPFAGALGDELSRATGAAIPVDAWGWSQIPVHLRMRFRVEDASGAILAESDDVGRLQHDLAPQMRAVMAGALKDLSRAGLRRWDIGSLPMRVERTVAGQRLLGYPALVDEGETVAVAVLESESAQRESMWQGTRRLLRFSIPMSVRTLRDRLDEQAGLALAVNPYAGLGALLEDVVVASLDAEMARHGGPAWDEAAFDRLRDAVAAGAPAQALAIVDRVAEIFAIAATVDRKMRGSVAATIVPARRDMANQRATLLYPGFVAAIGVEHLDDLPRYLRAILHRLDAVAKAPGRDRDRMHTVHRLEAAYARLADSRVGTDQDLALERIGWMIEELRVSLFAQHLGTRLPVSEARIEQALDQLGP